MSGPFRWAMNRPPANFACDVSAAWCWVWGQRPSESRALACISPLGTWVTFSNWHQNPALAIRITYIGTAQTQEPHCVPDGNALRMSAMGLPTGPPTGLPGAQRRRSCSKPLSQLEGNVQGQRQLPWGQCPGERDGSPAPPCPPGLPTASRSKRQPVWEKLRAPGCGVIVHCPRGRM